MQTIVSLKGNCGVHVSSILFNTTPSVLYILLMYFSKLLKLKFSTDYILLAYFPKLLRLRFLTHYTFYSIDLFSQAVEVEILNTPTHSIDLFSQAVEAEFFNHRQVIIIFENNIFAVGREPRM